MIYAIFYLLVLIACFLIVCFMILLAQAKKIQSGLNVLEILFCRIITINGNKEIFQKMIDILNKNADNMDKVVNVLEKLSPPAK